MKTVLTSLAVVLALTVGSTASAAVFVHAGPVTVAVGGGHRHYRPVAVRPVPRPVFAPGPAFVAPPAAAWSPNRITPRERREIHDETQDLRREIRQAGAHVSPREWREIRDEAQDVRREIRQSVRW